MGDLPLLLVGALGVLAAFVERRDGWRFVALAERLDRELADVRERLALLERGREHSDPAPAPAPRPWWAFWRNR
jgi:hypothetical protein